MERRTTVTTDRLQLSDPGENLKVRGKERKPAGSFQYYEDKNGDSRFVTEIIRLSPEGNHLLAALEGGMCDYRYVRDNSSAVRGQRANGSVGESGLVACDHSEYLLHVA
jgi:hypothetical protein